ncbi:MAG: hypothetical protein ACOYOK_03890, partial [Pseudobdellovibrionaceae bacterium]
QGLNPNGAKITSSVMDYIFGISSAIIGANIKNNALEYDQKFIEWSYIKEFDLLKTELPPFCSDGLAYTDKVLGCMIGDLGNNPFDTTSAQFKNKINSIVSLVLQSVVKSLHPENLSDQLSFKEILTFIGNIDMAKVDLAMELDQAKMSLSESSQYFDLNLKFGPRSWLNQIEYDLAYSEKIKRQLDVVGGVWGYFSSLYPLTQEGLVQRGWLKKLIVSYYEKPEFKKGISFEGVPYELTDTEYTFIGKLIDSFADKAEDYLLSSVLSKFTFKKLELGTPSSSGSSFSLFGSGAGSSEKSIRLDVNQEVWWPQLATLASDIILRRENTVSGVINGVQVQLPKAGFNFELRKKAIEILDGENYRIFDGEKKFITSASSNILGQFKQLLGKEFSSSTSVKDELKKTKLDLISKKWFDEELELLKSIDAKK